MAIKIYTDSCCDLPYTFIEDNSDVLRVIGIPVQLNGKEYIDDLGKTLSHDQFYEHLRSQVMPHTAQINSFMFESEFERDLENGDDLIYLGFSSGLSGTYNSSWIAKETLKEKYPERSICVIDTLSASVGLASIIFKVLTFMKEDKDFDYITNWVESNKLKVNHWFGVDNLDFLKNGGRISNTAAFVGNVLSLKPTLVVDRDGKLKPHTNVRGRKKSINFLASKVKEHIIDPNESILVIGHGNNLNDALKLKLAIEELMHIKEIYTTELSMTIASHVGPDMLAVGFLGTERDN